MLVQMVDTTVAAGVGRLFKGQVAALDEALAVHLCLAGIAHPWQWRPRAIIQAPPAPRALPPGPAVEAPRLLPERGVPRPRRAQPRFPVYRPLALPQRQPVPRRDPAVAHSPTGQAFRRRPWLNRHVPWAPKGEARQPELRSFMVLEDEAIVADLAGPFSLDEVMSRAARENAQATVAEIDMAYGWRYRWWQDWE